MSRWWSRPRGGRRARRWLPRTLRVTREGRTYLALTLGVGLAAVNTGNNLLFLVLGMLLALIVLSGLLSEAALRQLTLTRGVPGEARAGEPVLCRLEVRNRNRTLPAVGLVFEELSPEVEAPPARLLRLDAGAEAGVDLRLTPARRGELDLTEVRVATAYPFGIFEKARIFDVPGRLVVFPARVSARSAPAEPDRRGEGGRTRKAGGGEDLHGLKDLREGDDVRRVHWRRSLRVGSLQVLEREASAGRRVRLVVGSGEGEPYEARIRTVAAQAERHLARGDAVALEAPGVRLPFGEGRRQRLKVLTALARVPARPRREVRR